MKRERFDELEAALTELRRQVDAVRAEGPLADIKAVRNFEAGSRVAARLELSTGRWLRGTDAGVDVMGDGSLIAFAGGMRRRELEAEGEAVYDAMREHLADG